MLSRFLLLSVSRPVMAWSLSSSAVRPSVTKSAAAAASAAAVANSASAYRSTTTFLRYQSTGSSGIDDDSAISRSRAPFRMPRNSPDDSVPTNASKGTAKDVSTWQALGLWTELITALQVELKLPTPTPVQSLVIPTLLKEDAENTAFLAATGSGKTLYVFFLLLLLLIR